MIRALLFALALAGGAPALAQPAAPKTVPLWTVGAPGSEARRSEPEQAQDYWVKNVHNPSLTIFPADPAHANGASVIVIPGGGHRLIVWTTEGLNVARALNRMGITVFVLKYRLAGEEGSRYTVEGDAADDARRAVRWVRAHSGDYGLDPARIGVMGFSAGGEIVSLIADSPEPGHARAHDAIDRVSARPDFQILVFPGPRAAEARAPAAAPPAFLVAGSRDECCAAPTVALYEQLRKAGISAELHMYADSGHAFNLDESNRISIVHWPDRLHDWLADGGWLDDRSRRTAPTTRSR
ncbi:alpha/beta hydrolase [Sphingomonas parva]|uniref:Alpha/beta hydrolase n=1 Tax=Sphingomonas parva TaxID=2555898 RepID=A0A4Y8ZTX8_9SPHN|nr:alpha/beta hydrolase [Sphingomonas parva]TFI59460.1 alpha/beta hydrolase [Sphingomonas parva]